MSSPFKAYDVRGEVPGQVNVPFAYRFGLAAAGCLGPRSAVVGHDMRSDSPALAAAVAQGLLDSGVDVLPAGRCGTEEVYFHTADTDADLGLMVTASHNPANYNGIKMVLKGARAATRENALDAIEEAVLSGRRLATVASFAGRGRLAPELPRRTYVERLLRQVEGLRPRAAEDPLPCRQRLRRTGRRRARAAPAVHLRQARPRTRPGPSERRPESAAAGEALARRRGGGGQRRRPRHRLGR